MNDDDSIHIAAVLLGGGACLVGMEMPEGGEKEGVKQLELWTD